NVDDYHAERLRLLVHLAGDGAHQRLAFIAHDGDEACAAKHAPQRRLKHGAQPRISSLLVAHRLEEQERIDDLVAREGVDDEALLIRCDHFLGTRVDVENALVEIFDVLDERNFEIEARAGILRTEQIAARLLAAGLFGGALLRRRQPARRVDNTNRIAELQHQRLLRLLDSEERKISNDRGDREWHK